jgi:D-beta-D-heptose 7-phosphate kinase/D-beta-D-heptose 1-phosphate adenosyltransferase
VRQLKGKNRPILRLAERQEVLTSLSAVDFVIPFSESTPRRLIEQIVPDILIKGGDWKAENIVGADIVKANGGRVVSGILVKGRSTTSIIRAIQKR